MNTPPRDPDADLAACAAAQADLENTDPSKKEMFLCTNGVGLEMFAELAMDAIPYWIRQAIWSREESRENYQYYIDAYDELKRLRQALWSECERRVEAEEELANVEDLRQYPHLLAMVAKAGAFLQAGR